MQPNLPVHMMEVAFAKKECVMAYEIVNLTIQMKKTVLVSHLNIEQVVRVAQNKFSSCLLYFVTHALFFR